ncbi:putative hydrolase of the HAD superfamily [Chitinivorax tropicus]|uniref:Putative hydrolase of the HAD superfamily n=1 Tax=Chitinivorax tropicus TaxID=714531 RepID=A0A840MN60_9PROT|nr:HAD family hydrolase [Chitinivorax tropicus]MBB5018407.1 putative hydrolase of the HAD superfamily [Chitinivorax tropicus]
MPIAVALFDLDDTLFDHHHATNVALKTVFQEYIAPSDIPFDDFASVHLELMDRLHHQHMVLGRLSLGQVREIRFEQLLAHFGLDLPHTPAQLAARQRSVFLENRRLIDGARSLLEALRAQGIQIGIVTNNMLNEQIDKLAHLQIANLIDQLITVDMVGAGKPEPDIFHYALHRHHCKPEQAVMVGDSWPNDVIGAHRAGIRPVWLNRHHQARPDATPCVEIHQLTPTDEALDAILNGPV